MVHTSFAQMVVGAYLEGTVSAQIRVTCVRWVALHRLGGYLRKVGWLYTNERVICVRWVGSTKIKGGIFVRWVFLHRLGLSA